MTNLDRLADSDLLMQGFVDFMRRWTASRVDEELTEEIPSESFSFDEDLPEALRSFYQLRSELPHAHLGGAHDFGDPSPRESGHIWFAELSSNWHLGVVRAPDSAWQLCRYTATEDRWESFPAIRLDHLLVESGLISQFYLPHTVEMDDTESGPDPDVEWDRATASAQTVWTGKIDRDAGIYCFEYVRRSFLWDPEGILFYEEIEYNDWDDWVMKTRYASFATRAAASKFAAMPEWKPKRLILTS